MITEAGFNLYKLESMASKKIRDLNFFQQKLNALFHVSKENENKIREKLKELKKNNEKNQFSFEFDPFTYEKVEKFATPMFPIPKTGKKRKRKAVLPKTDKRILITLLLPFFKGEKEGNPELYENIAIEFNRNPKKTFKGDINGNYVSNFRNNRRNDFLDLLD